MSRELSRRAALGLIGGALVAPATAQSETGIRIELPFIAENGASVPLTVAVDRPMTPALYVEQLTCFAPGNPIQEIGEYYFSPLSGRAEIATLIRLDKTQSVTAIARMSNGEVLSATREIQVVVTGCLLNPTTYATEDPMRTRVRVHPPAAAGAPAEVATMINHPMESGRRTDLAGAAIPKNLVERLHVSFRRATIFEARFHASTAVNPYLRFFFVPDGGGELALRWEEDAGRIAEERVAVNVA